MPAKNNDDLLFDRQRRVLILLQNFRQPLAAGKLRQRGLIEIRSELRECRQFAELRKIQSQRTGDLPHGFDLRVASDARHRDTDVHCRANAGVEQIAFQKDLSVGNRNDVRRNVRGNVAGLRFDDRQARSAIRRPVSSLSFAARSSKRE